MPISIENYSNSDYSRIDRSRQSTETSATASKGAASSSGGGQLVGGSTISGQIVAKEGDQVTIRLGNDQTISAKLQGNADIEVGMRLTFEVAKGANDQTALRPLFSNLSNSNAAMSALRAAGLPVNNTTLAMTDRMMTESMPVNKNALVDMFRNVSAHSNVSPESIVQMTKLNMPLTDSNVIQFDNYRNFEHQILNDLQSVSDGIADLFNEAVTLAETSGTDGSEAFAGMTAGDVIKEVLDLIDPNSLDTITAPEAAEAEVAGGKAAEAGSGAQTVQDANTLQEAKTMPQPDTAQTAQGASSMSEAAHAGNRMAFIPDAAVTTQSAATLQSSLADGLTGSADQALSLTSEAVFNPELSLTADEQMTLSSDLQNILILAGEGADIHEPLDPSQIMTAVKQLVDDYPPAVSRIEGGDLPAYSEESYEAADDENANGLARADIAALKAHTATDAVASEIAGKDVGTDTETDPETTKSAISKKLNELLRSDGFTKLLKDSVKAQMSIRPQDVAQSGKTEELYDRIRRTSAKVADLMSNIGRADSAVASSAGALTDNVNFMNQLNEFVNYIQLPLKMTGQDANGELYVYTNRKNLANRDGNYSALLHLDMEHLGPMDVYVTMRDHTKVSTNFYLENEDVLSFIEQHIDELTQRLTEKGYNTSTHVTERAPGEKIGPIADEFTKEDATTRQPVAVAQMRFDVRA